MRPHALGSSTASRRRQLVFFVADGRQSRYPQALAAINKALELAVIASLLVTSARAGDHVPFVEPVSMLSGALLADSFDGTHLNANLWWRPNWMVQNDPYISVGVEKRKTAYFRPLASSRYGSSICRSNFKVLSRNRRGACRQNSSSILLRKGWKNPAYGSSLHGRLARLLHGDHFRPDFDRPAKMVRSIRRQDMGAFRIYPVPRTYACRHERRSTGMAHGRAQT